MSTDHHARDHTPAVRGKRRRCRAKILSAGSANPLRDDATPKVTGEFAYSSDLQAAGMLWGHTLRSPHAHARIV